MICESSFAILPPNLLSPPSPTSALKVSPPLLFFSLYHAPHSCTITRAALLPPHSHPLTPHTLASRASTASHTHTHTHIHTHLPITHTCTVHTCTHTFPSHTHALYLHARTHTHLAPPPTARKRTTLRGAQMSSSAHLVATLTSNCQHLLKVVSAP